MEEQLDHTLELGERYRQLATIIVDLQAADTAMFAWKGNKVHTYVLAQEGGFITKEENDEVIKAMKAPLQKLLLDKYYEMGREMEKAANRLAAEIASERIKDEEFSNPGNRDNSEVNCNFNFH